MNTPLSLFCLVVLLNSICAFRLLGENRAIRATRLFAGKVALVANGKRIEFESGTSMFAACTKLGLKVPTDCRKGECGTCTVTVGGNKIRACIGKVPEPPKLKSIQEKGLSVSVDNL